MIQCGRVVMKSITSRSYVQTPLIIAVLVLQILLLLQSTVQAKSCYATLNSNDIFFRGLEFSSGRASTFLDGYYVTNRLSDIQFEQDTSSSDQQVRSHLVVCPVPRGSSVVCNKSMVDLHSQAILSDKYGFQYDAIYTTIRMNPVDPSMLQIGKYNHPAKGSENWKQFQPMGTEVTTGLSMMKPQLQFEPVVGNIYLFNISRPLLINGVPQDVYSHDIVKMMVVSLVGSSLTIRWDVLYSSTGRVVDCYIEGDASFKLQISDSLPSVPAVLGTHVVVFVSVVSLGVCVLSMFVYQIFKCRCFTRSKYYGLDH